MPRTSERFIWVAFAVVLLSVGAGVLKGLLSDASPQKNAVAHSPPQSLLPPATVPSEAISPEEIRFAEESLQDRNRLVDRINELEDEKRFLLDKLGWTEATFVKVRKPKETVVQRPVVSTRPPPATRSRPQQSIFDSN